MADSIDMILPMLREMRAESAGRFDDIAARLDKLEAAQVSFRHAPSADSMLSKLVTGDFQERIETLDKRVQDQEARAS